MLSTVEVLNVKKNLDVCRYSLAVELGHKPEV